MTTCLGKGCRFTMRVFRERLSVRVCSVFPFGFEGGMWDLVVFVPDHCPFMYFKSVSKTNVD